MLALKFRSGASKDRGGSNFSSLKGIFVWTSAFGLLCIFCPGSSTHGAQVNSFGDPLSKESGWTPIANHIFSYRQQDSRDHYPSAPITQQQVWMQQPLIPSASAKSILLPPSTPTALISSPNLRPIPIPVRNELENHAYRRRPSPPQSPNSKPHLRQKLVHPRRRKDNKKNIPNFFLQKVARKVFFPDRRVDRDHLGRPVPKVRFEKNNKPVFPPRNPPIRNVSNRLRPYQPVICAFRTESIGLEGERCVQV